MGMKENEHEEITKGRVFPGVSSEVQSADDERIYAEVCEKLYGGIHDNANITVHVKDRRVTLEGNVTSLAQSEDIEELARNIDGVEEIENNLSVQHAADYYDDFDATEVSEDYNRMNEQTHFPNNRDRYSNKIENRRSKGVLYE